MHIYGDHVTTTKQTNVAASYIKGLKKQVNRLEDCSGSSSQGVSLWQKGSYCASFLTFFFQLRWFYMICSLSLSKSFCLFFGDNLYLLYCWRALDLPQVQSVLYCVQVSCPKRWFLYYRCHTHAMIHPFLTLLLVTDTLSQIFQIFWYFSHCLVANWLVRKTLYTLQQYLIWSNCWRHLAPYREYMSTYKLRLVAPSPLLN